MKNDIFMKNYDFPIDSVEIDYSKNSLNKNFESPHLCRTHLMVNENDFYLDIPDIAQYRVKFGKNILIHLYKDYDEASVKSFLYGSVLGALLHQRSILPFHGNSFEYFGKGIIICGHSGSGKSSISAALCQNGGNFISDDISPIHFKNSEAYIFNINNRLKLWDNTIHELDISNIELEKIRPTINKFYISNLNSPDNLEKKLDHLFILSTHNKNKFSVIELTGISKFNALRKQIFRKIFLKGMPYLERDYFKQILHLASTVRVTHIIRPQICNIYETMKIFQKELAR
jgi:hypothetical protein